ncbi:MAG: YjbE family putative metal transport protein [Rectinemataceae bacterium]
MIPQIDAGFALGFLNVTLIDIALSGDNAIVIGMAAAALPRRRRTRVIVAGGALAILLRVLLTYAAAMLLLLPFLSALGGLLLVWIAYGLLRIETPGGGTTDTRKGPASPRQAIFYIVAADLTMSLDNVLAVAGAAKGSVALLVAGLVISMPLLMATGGFVAVLIDRARWLIYVGAAAISYTAARMVLEDRALGPLLRVSGPLIAAICLAAGILFPLAFFGLERMLSKRKKRTAGKAKNEDATT